MKAFGTVKTLSVVEPFSSARLDLEQVGFVYFQKVATTLLFSNVIRLLYFTYILNQF